MKSLVFDTGVIISLSSNGLLWLLEPMRKKFKGQFVIPASVKLEIIDMPLQSLRFKLEAMQVLSEVAKGNMMLYDGQDTSEVNEVLKLANNLFKARNSYIQILHPGEVGAIVLAKKLNADALLIDERTTRVLLEDPMRMRELLQSKLHTRVDVDPENLQKFREYTKGIKVIRSVEFCVVAYELGLFDRYALPSEKKYVHGELKRRLLEGIIWGLKLRGCSMSDEEVDDYIALEGFRNIN